MAEQNENLHMRIIEDDDDEVRDDESAVTTNSVETENDEEEEELEEEEPEEAEEEAEEVVVEAIEAKKTPWKLDRKKLKSIFDKKKMREYTDIRKVLGFIEAEMGITFQGNARYAGMPKELKTELDLMKAYAEKYDDSGGYFSVAHTMPKHKWGRTIPAGYMSLSVQHRPTRHALCDGVYRDKDMRNCHPQLIAEIAEQHGVPMPKLKKYNDNYKAYRQRICQHHGLDWNNPDHKNIAKQLPIRLVYGGTYDNWIKDHNIQVNIRPHEKMGKFVAIEAELAGIREVVWTNNQDIYKDVIRQDPKKWRNEAEAKRGVQGLWCQTIERLIMEECVAYLVEEKDFKLEDIVPCQDGLMVKAELNYPEMEAELEQRVLETFGLAVKWDDKDFDEAIEIPLYTKRIISTEEWFDLITPKPMAERLKELRKDKILFNYSTGELFVYQGNRWYNESKIEKAHKLRRIISEDLYDDTMRELAGCPAIKKEARELLTKLIRSATCKSAGYTDIIKQLISIADPAGENQFDGNPYLLGFENGKVDLRTNEFTEYEPTDYITLTTLYNFRRPDYVNNEEDKAVRDTWVKLLSEIQPEVDRQTLLIQILASGLDGNGYQAMWYFNGRGGNGKGLLGRQQEKVLGENFAITPSNALLTEDRQTSANAPSPAIAELRHKRWICFKEMGGTIHLPAQRRLTGGDTLRGRQLHCDNVKVAIEGTMVGEFNKMPDYDQEPQDADYRRGRNIQFDNNWSLDPNKIDKTINGIYYRQGNPYYETEEWLLKSRDVYLDMLLGCYQQSYSDVIKKIDFTIPQSVWDASRKMVDENNKFKQWFDRCYDPSPSRAVDIVIKRKEVKWDNATNKNKTETITETPSRIKIGDLWETISNSTEYKSGQRTKAREFERSWGKKEFFRWAKSSLPVIATSKYEYVIGYKPSDSPEIIWSLNTNGEHIGWALDEEDEDDLA
jgi:phage/plasmid-associated DNA primase